MKGRVSEGLNILYPNDARMLYSVDKINDIINKRWILLRSPNLSSQADK